MDDTRDQTPEKTTTELDSSRDPIRAEPVVECVERGGTTFRCVQGLASVVMDQG
jgi:hypothetical protein